MNDRPFFDAPRFMTDVELRAYFGLTERALRRLRYKRTFPQRDDLMKKTDRRAVELFFDRRAGIGFSSREPGNPAGFTGVENFDD